MTDPIQVPTMYLQEKSQALRVNVDRLTLITDGSLAPASEQTQLLREIKALAAVLEMEADQWLGVFERSEPVPEATIVKALEPTTTRVADEAPADSPLSMPDWTGR